MNTKDLDKFTNHSGKILDCIVCEDRFFAAQHRIKPNVVLTCSKKCAGTYRKSQAILNVSCAQCGSKFHMKPSHALKIQEPSCSEGCCLELQKRRMSGDRNHQYGLRGALNSSWCGGRKLTTYGYIKEGGVLEHRKVWLSSGKSIPDGYVVHHKNHIKTDNRLNNLEVMSLSDHTGMHSIASSQLRSGINGRLLKDHSLEQGRQYICDNYSTLLPQALTFLGITEDCISFELPRPRINKLYNVDDVNLEDLTEHIKCSLSSGDNVAVKGAIMILTYKLYLEGDMNGSL